MKLSEAIRLGAMLRPQVRFETRNKSGTCALGAALEAMGSSACYLEAASLWPYCGHGSNVEHPVTHEGMMLLSAIRDLNDEHKWTRERIADWVEQIENQHEATQPEREVSRVK